MNPGEVYWVDLPAGRRPAIVVSREDLNRGSYVIVVLCTSAQLQLRSTLPNCVAFSAGEFGMPKDCVAQAETISFLNTADLDLTTGPLGKLDDLRQRELIKAIGFVFDADCEPN